MASDVSTDEFLGPSRFTPSPRGKWPPAWRLAMKGPDQELATEKYRQFAGTYDRLVQAAGGVRGTAVALLRLDASATI